MIGVGDELEIEKIESVFFYFLLFCLLIFYFK